MWGYKGEKLTYSASFVWKSTKKVVKLLETEFTKMLLVLVYTAFLSVCSWKPSTRVCVGTSISQNFALRNVMDLHGLTSKLKRAFVELGNGYVKHSCQDGWPRYWMVYWPESFGGNIRQPHAVLRWSKIVTAYPCRASLPGEKKRKAIKSKIACHVMFIFSLLGVFCRCFGIVGVCFRLRLGAKGLWSASIFKGQRARR